MKSSTFRRISGVVAICTGGYSILGSTGGFSRILHEEIMFGLGIVAILYGAALFTNRAEQLKEWNAKMFIILAGLMALNQFAYDPTPAFADGEMWADNPGTQVWMYIFIGALGLLGVASWRCEKGD